MSKKFVFELIMDEIPPSNLVNGIITEVSMEREAEEIKRNNYVKVSNKIKEVLEVLKVEVNQTLKPLGITAKMGEPRDCYYHRLTIGKMLGIEVSCPASNGILIFEPKISILRFYSDGGYGKKDFISITQLIEDYRDELKIMYLQS